MALKQREITKLLQKSKLEAMLIITVPNIRYITGFTGRDSYLLLTQDKSFIITDSRYTEQVSKECPDFLIIDWRAKNQSLPVAIGELCKKLSLQNIGFEQEKITLLLYEQLQENLSGIKTVPTIGLIEKMRYIKKPEEVAAIKKAAQAADLGFEKLLPKIKPGKTEAELALELEYLIRKQPGIEGMSFPTIFISGANTSLPHGIPSDKFLTEGDFITMDFGAIYDGYCSDMTRTVVLGKASAKQKELYNIVLEAQLLGLSTLKAGLMGKETDGKVREYFKKHNLEQYFGHSLGHGLGLEIHEQPFMGPNCTQIVEEKCVVTIEPGLYLPGFGGVRIEDTVLVNKNKVERLTFATKELLEL